MFEKENGKWEVKVTFSAAVVIGILVPAACKKSPQYTFTIRSFLIVANNLPVRIQHTL